MNKLKLFFGLFLGALAATSAVHLASAHNDFFKKANAAGEISLIGSLNSTSGGQTASSWDKDYDLSDNDNDGVYSVELFLKAKDEFKIRLDHGWTKSYDTLGTYPTGIFEIKDGGNVLVKDALKADTKFRVDFDSTTQIIEIWNVTNPVSTRTFYVLQNTDWGDWANPRLHWWGSSTMTNSYGNCVRPISMGRQYTAENTTGNLYKCTIPSDITGMLIRKADFSAQTSDLAIDSSINAAKFYYEDADKLYGFNLTVVDNGAYLRGDWTKGGHDGWTVDGQIAMTSSSINGPYSITGVDLGAGSAVKAVYMQDGVETWAQFNSVSTNSEELYPVIEVDDGKGGHNAGVQSRGTYNIVVTKNGTNWDYAFTGTANLDLDDAIDFAENFVTAMVANCPHTSTGGSSSKVASTWSTQKGIYEALDEDVQIYLLDADSTVKEIEDFFSSYDYIYGHYASVREITGADFLERNPATVASLSINLIGVSINGNGAAPIIVSVIAVLSLTAIGGYYFLKKGKKEKENTK